VARELAFNSITPILAADRWARLGLPPEDQVLPHVHAGHLLRVLEDWCPPFPGYHFY